MDDVKIEVLAIHPGGQGKIKGTVDIRVGFIEIRGVKIIQGQHGDFIGFPQKYGKDEAGNAKWEDFIVVSRELKQDISDTILYEWKDMISNRPVSEPPTSKEDEIPF